MPHDLRVLSFRKHLRIASSYLQDLRNWLPASGLISGWFLPNNYVHHYLLYSFPSSFFSVNAITKILGHPGLFLPFSCLITKFCPLFFCNLKIKNNFFKSPIVHVGSFLTELVQG